MLLIEVKVFQLAKKSKLLSDFRSGLDHCCLQIIYFSCILYLAFFTQLWNKITNYINLF